MTFDVSFLFGGQIMGERMRLFMIYSAGNFIECTTDTPYLQIGEHKYGKPVLDRAVSYEMDLYDALKVGLVSIDSTMRSNLSVGMPIDLLVVRRDTCEAELIYRIEPGEPYFTDLRERWSAALRAAHIGIPRPPYGRRVLSRKGDRRFLRKIKPATRFTRARLGDRPLGKIASDLQSFLPMVAANQNIKRVGACRLRRRSASPRRPKSRGGTTRASAWSCRSA